MADFKTAYNITNKHEGYYVNVSWDLGRETYKGISRRFHPNWSGWTMIDGWKAKNGQPKWNQNLDPLIPGLAAAHERYSRTVFWNAIKGDDIHNQNFANLFYDVYWGFPGVIRPLQGWLGVAQDGIVGPITIRAINTAPNLNAIYKKLIDWRMEEFRKSSIWEQAKNGWTARSNSFPQDINTRYFATSKSDNLVQKASLIVLAILFFSKIKN
jgi:lysozyme family protein